ncbi:MAG: PQQ-binding-like beta-propeller repeat protein [Saprospiraceae bacterium]|nr:PQQ-binding-like beta-propeller repeat protein [Saprospiraceae bacterium]
MVLSSFSQLSPIWVSLKKGSYELGFKSTFEFDHSRMYFYLSSPAIYKNTIYFGSGNGYLYAINKVNGKEIWKYKTNGIIHSSPAIAFGIVYFVGWDTYMYAVNAKTGKEVWKFKIDEDTVNYNQTGITSSPSISDSMIYFGCRDSWLYAVEALSGQLAWKKYNDDTRICATPVIYKNKVMYGSGKQQKFNVLNKTSGDSIYQIKTTDYFSSPSIAGNTFYFGDYIGFINARDVHTGKIIWSYQLPSSLADTFKILNPDHIFNPEKYTIAHEKFKHKITELQIRFSVGTILSSSVIKNGELYVGSCDG